MSNNEIVELYYDFVMELANKWKVNEDCVQMFFVDFLLYDNVKLNNIHNKKEMKFWITRVMKNYWFSKTSRYYTTYNKYYEYFDDYKEDQSE
jgi:hypothetical protein